MEADPPLKTEYLQVLTKLRARAEALRWLCQSGRILDVVNGCAKYPVLINKAGAHFGGSAESVGGRTVGVVVFMQIKSHSLLLKFGPSLGATDPYGVGQNRKYSPGLQPIVNRLRRVLPGIAHVGCLSLPPPDTMDPSDIAIACAAVQVHAERKRRWPTDEDVTELSTFPLYSDRSQADAQTQVRRWYLACHMVIHSHRAARVRMPDCQ